MIYAQSDHLLSIFGPKHIWNCIEISILLWYLANKLSIIETWEQLINFPKIVHLKAVLYPKNLLKYQAKVYGNDKTQGFCKTYQKFKYISDSNIKLNLAFLGTFPVQHCFWLCLDCYCLCFCCLFEEWCCSVITPCPEKSTDLFGIKAVIKPDPFSVTIITLLKHILWSVKEPMEADFC